MSRSNQPRLSINAPSLPFSEIKIYWYPLFVPHYPAVTRTTASYASEDDFLAKPQILTSLHPYLVFTCTSSSPPEAHRLY